MKRWMLLLLGVTAIFIVGYLIWNNPDGKEREARLVAEYQAIKHPEGTKLVAYELTRKIIIRSIHSEYTYTIGNDEVEKYYDQELIIKGWRRVPRKSGPEDVLYVKDNLILEFGLNKNNSWTLSMAYSDATY